jgi:hypothetical protein
MSKLQRAGGLAALYMAAAYVVAIPYFLLLVDYPSVVDPLQKVVLLRDNFTSMYAMHVIVYEFVGLGLIVLALAIHHRLKVGAPATAQVATAIGLIWACLLLASSMVFNYGMEAAVSLYATDAAQAVRLWQAFETVGQGLGGAGGERLVDVARELGGPSNGSLAQGAELVRAGDRRRRSRLGRTCFECGGRLRCSTSCGSPGWAWFCCARPACSSLGSSSLSMPASSLCAYLAGGFGGTMAWRQP